MMTFEHFSEMNRARCESKHGFKHKLDGWTSSDWMTAIMGELGEAANIVKKLNRYRDNIPGNKETVDVLRANLSRELADTFTYLDLFCQSQGIRLGDVVCDTFNTKSEEIGYPVKLNGFWPASVESDGDGKVETV